MQNCADKTAKCFTVTCHFDFLDVDAAAVIDFRSRLWNATFVEVSFLIKSKKPISIAILQNCNHLHTESLQIFMLNNMKFKNLIHTFE